MKTEMIFLSKQCEMVLMKMDLKQNTVVYNLERSNLMSV